MNRPSILARTVGLFVFGLSAVACYADVHSGPPAEECRNVEVRHRRDVEVCHERCHDNGCHEHCNEQERWSREHRCWVE